VAAHVWKIVYLKCDPFFPKCLRFLVDISENIPVFLKNVGALVIPQNKIPYVMIFHCTPVLCCIV
jgi:hypothetical protein